MATDRIPGSKRSDTQMSVHTSIQNTYVSLAQEFQKHLSNESPKHVNIDHARHKKLNFKKLDKQRLSCAT